MNLRRILGSLGAALAVLGLQFGCVDLPGEASLGGTSLYVFDAASESVLVWDDTTAVFAGSTLPTATRTITGSSLRSVVDLGWGGMAMSSAGNSLFLVSKSGKVVRISRVRAQNGWLSSTTDIALFTLDTSSRLGSDSVFGQAAVDSTTGALYVTETTASDARVWAVSSPGSFKDGDTVSLSEIALSSGTDSHCTGVAAAQGIVYAYFGDGDNITSPSGTVYSGARIRKSLSGIFPQSGQVIVYGDTTLGATGSLGLDRSNSLLYVLRRTASNLAGDPPILAYSTGSFTNGFNASQKVTLGTSAAMPNLRFITHAGSKNWLAGANMISDAGSTTLWLWQNPNLGGDPHSYELTGGKILGIAFDGTN